VKQDEKYFKTWDKTITFKCSYSAQSFHCSTGVCIAREQAKGGKFRFQALS
jgi:hypothetical protein